MSVPLVKGVRVGTGLRWWYGVWCVVTVCLKNCYVAKDVREGSVEACLLEFFRKSWRGVCKHN